MVAVLYIPLPHLQTNCQNCRLCSLFRLLVALCRHCLLRPYLHITTTKALQLIIHKKLLLNHCESIPNTKQKKKKTQILPLSQLPLPFLIFNINIAYQIFDCNINAFFSFTKLITKFKKYPISNTLFKTINQITTGLQ